MESPPKLRQKKTKCLGNIQDTENKIRSRAAEVKQHLARLIDLQVNDLLLELQSLKSVA